MDPAANPGMNPSMDPNSEWGRPNPKAPAELARFAFLIGRWRCTAKVRLDTGAWQTFAGMWIGRYILDGYVIADEYRMTGPAGELLVLGLNLRSYEAARQTWHIKWISGLSGAWTDLGLEEMGGVRFSGQSVTYVFKESMMGHALTRATYTNISAGHFTWRGESSEDGKSWQPFMVVECDRA